MLPANTLAADLTEILTNLAALNLQPNTAAAVLGAVLAPLLRSSELEKEKRAGRPGPKRGELRGASGRKPRSRPRGDPNGG